MAAPAALNPCQTAAPPPPREWFRDYFDDSPEAVFLETTEGLVLEVNPAACALHGLSRGELIGRTVLDLVPEALRPMVQQEFRRLVTGELQVAEGESLRADGSSVPVELRVTRLRQEGENVLLLQVHDISIRRQALRALAEERVRFRGLFDHAPIALWEMDLRPLMDWLLQAKRSGVADVARWLCEDAGRVAAALGLVRLTGRNVAARHWDEPEDAAGKGLPRAVLGDGRETFIRLCERLARGGTTFHLESVTRQIHGRLCCLALDLQVLKRLGVADYGQTMLAGIDVTAGRLALDRLEEQRVILEMIACGEPMERVLTQLARQLEASCEGLLVCVFLASPVDQVLEPKAAPSLPPEALALMAQAGRVGCKSTVWLAAQTGQRIELPDLRAEVVPEFCREMAMKFNLGACVASPIRSREQRVVGVLAGYYRTPRMVPEAHCEAIDAALALVAVAVERHMRDLALQAAHTALQASEEHYRSVVDALGEGVVLADALGTVICLNRAAEAILGLAQGEAPAPWTDNCFWQAPVTGRELPATVGFAIALTFGTGQPCSDLVVGLRRRDQRVVWLSVNTRLLGNQAGTEQRQIVVSFTDITERHSAQRGLEERTALLRAISEVQASFIGEAEPADAFRRIIEQMAALTSSQRMLLCKVNRQPGAPARLIAQAAIPTGQESRLMDEFGTLLHTAWQTGQVASCPNASGAAPLPDHPTSEAPTSSVALPLKCGGQVVGVVALEMPGQSDASEATGALEPFLATCAGILEATRLQRRREAAEADLRRLNTELERRVSERTAELAATNFDLSEFAYVVTHDLKAPLRGVSQLCEWIARDHQERLNPDGLRYFGMLRERVRHLHSLVGGLLECARVGRAPELETDVAVGPLAHGVVEHLAPAPNITVRIAPDLPVVRAFAPRLEQVLQNLLDNAIKYLDKPVGEVSLVARRGEGEWVFTVEDNGPGIPPQFHEKALQMFQRLCMDASRPGTGLGLPLVKRIVENRGGRLWIESDGLLGTRMHFSWPDHARRQPPASETQPNGT